MEQLFKDWELLSGRTVCAELYSRASLFSAGSLPSGVPVIQSMSRSMSRDLGHCGVPGKAALRSLCPVIRCQCPLQVSSTERIPPDPWEPFDLCHLGRCWVREWCWDVRSEMQQEELGSAPGAAVDAGRQRELLLCATAVPTRPRRWQGPCPPRDRETATAKGGNAEAGSEREAAGEMSP